MRRLWTVRLRGLCRRICRRLWITRLCLCQRMCGVASEASLEIDCCASEATALPFCSCDASRELAYETTRPPE